MEDYFKNDIRFISNCCCAFMSDYPDSDICPECKEHCQAIQENEMQNDD